MVEGIEPRWDEIPAIQDREVAKPEDDRFGHRDLELALRGLLESDKHSPPYSVGLLGRWGSGKSTVRALYESRLGEDAARNRRIRTISFDAWRFGKEEVKRALLRHVFSELGGDDSQLRDELYRQVQRHSTEDRPFTEIMADLRALWKAVAVQFILLLLAVLVIAVGVLFLLNIDTALARSLVVAAAIGSLPFLARYLLNPVPWRANVTRLDLPRTTAEQYEEFLKDRLVAYGQENPDIEKLVVFVDDLDRLPAEEMVDGLDAVRGFMDIPGGVAGAPGVVFVISCDEGKVAEALTDRRRRNDSELPATISSKEDARRYLDRIFQFRLEVPLPPKRDMRGYAKRRLQEDLTLVAQDLEGKEITLDDVVDRMIHPGVQSPRTAVHMLNTFSRSWWLARRREREGGATRAGGLVEGAVTNHPQTLAALAALQVDFPEFYDDLQDNPDLLDAFSSVFVDGTPIREQATGLHDVLDGYRLSSPDGNDGEGSAVKPRYRSLRSFVSGLRGLRRPRNLRPLIELSQDQLSRDLGPRGAEVRAAFVAGDTRGVLESLGRANDDRPLSAEELARLRDVVEDTEGETPTRRDNGGLVMAEIADRVPAEHTAGLLDSLAFRLRESKDLRSRAGVTRIASLLPRLRVENERDLAGTMVADIMRADGDIALETPNLQAPSLYDAIAMARTTVEAVLEVRERVGLTPASNEALLNWLTIRHVSSAGDEYEFPFSDLEVWVAQHEENLLLDLGSGYTGIIASSAAEDRFFSGVDSAETARRSRKVFERLATGGRQDHAVLWDQLTAYVSAADTEIARVAWEFAAQDTSTADPDHLSALVGALADRASTAGESHEEGDTVAPGAGEALVRVYRSRAGEVEEEAQEKVAELASGWSREYYEEDGRDLGGYAAALAEALSDVRSAQFSPLWGDWSGRLLNDLNPSCRRWLATSLSRMNPNGRKAAVAGLSEIPGGTNIDEEVAEKYDQFASALNNAAKGTDEMVAHLGQVAQRIVALVPDQTQAPQYGGNIQPVIVQVENYASRVLPAIARVLPYVPADEAASMLDRLFSGGLYIDHAHPLFLDLHAAMIDYWPSSDDIPYHSEAIFARAEVVANGEPELGRAPELLQSMSSLVAADGLGDGYRRRVLDTACALWPYHREFSLEIITAGEEVPSPVPVATLAQETNPDDAEESAALGRAWEHCATHHSRDEVVDVARTLLERTPDENASDPDWALGLWLRTTPHAQVILTQFFSNPEVADEDLERLWTRALADRERLGPSFFQTVLPQLFEREGVERTISAVRGSKDQITELFDGPSAKNELGRNLLEAFVASQRNSDKGFLAQWVKDAPAVGSLGHLNNLDPTESDLEILAGVFGGSSRFQVYLDRRNAG